MAAPPPVYLWHEPEWFDGVSGSFAYWTGSSKATGAWGIAGPFSDGHFAALTRIDRLVERSPHEWLIRFDGHNWRR